MEVLENNILIMKNFLWLLGFLQTVSLLWWVYLMLITKPTFNNGKNRLSKNWNEGGFVTLLFISILSVSISLVVTLIVKVLC